MVDYEDSAAGMDYDDESSAPKRDFGAALLEGGPDALLEQLEEMVPESWREQIARYPMAALTLGFGVGLYLGMKRGSEVVSAGSAMLSAAATANMGRIMSELGVD